MSDEQDFGFKYRIGQDVTCRGMIFSEQGDGTRIRAQRMVVVGCFLELCEGGIQRSYNVRIFDVTERGWDPTSKGVGAIKDFYRFMESELVEWTQPA